MNRDLAPLKQKYPDHFANYMDDVAIGTDDTPARQQLHQQIVHEFLDILDVTDETLGSNRGPYSRLSSYLEGKREYIEPSTTGDSTWSPSSYYRCLKYDREGVTTETDTNTYYKGNEKARQSNIRFRNLPQYMSAPSHPRSRLLYDTTPLFLTIPDLLCPNTYTYPLYGRPLDYLVGTSNSATRRGAC
jgi:hypothetical protein